MFSESPTRRHCCALTRRPVGRAAVAKPGESRFAFSSQQFAQRGRTRGTTNGKRILLCQPGGFEKFFDEAAQGPPLTSQDAADLHKLHLLHAKYGMELLGPPLFPPP
jgi:hypothetical protein